MATKKITLKDKGDNELYPKTAAQLVQVAENENLVQYLAKILKGTIPVGKVSNKLKLKDASGTEKEFDGSAGVDLSGGVHYATTATNLDSAPTITNSGTNGINITVGGKGTGSYTIPYATKAKQDKDNNDIDTTYAKIQDLKDGDVVPFKADSLVYGEDNITAQGIIDTAISGVKGELGDVATQTELNALESKVNTNTSEIKKIKEGPTFVYGAERDGDGMDIVSRYAKQADFNQYKTTTDDKISKIQASTTSAYVSQGSVQNLTELHSVSNVAKGYVYNMLNAGVLNEGEENERPFPAGANVVYIGENGADADPSNDNNWDLLGGIVDLSPYETKENAQTTYATKTQLNGKQDKISDLETIRQGAAKGATALQSYTEKYTGTITAVKANGTSIATSGEANIPAASTSAYGVTKLSSATNNASEVLAATPKAVKSAYDLANGKYTKPSTGIPKTDLASAVQTSLGKADTALQSHQDISGKLDKTTAEATYAKKTDLINLTYEYDTTGGTDEVTY